MSSLPGKDARDSVRTHDERALAVALKYAPGDAAPKVVAKGRGLIADEIIARAQAHGVFVHESPELVTLLSQVDLDDHIPPTLYIAVAELLAWLYRVEQKDLTQNTLPLPAP
jgi:flagellar biosynthesis protein